LVASVAAAVTSRNAIAVSATADGDERHLKFAQFGPGGWPASPSLIRPVVSGAMNPAVDVALDDFGTATLLHSQTGIVSGALGQVLLARFIPTIGWTPDVALANSAPNFDQLRVAVDHNGRGLAIWVNRDGSLSARRFE
jgi:hypothetical protein